MKKLITVLLPAILFGTATASLYAATPATESHAPKDGAKTGITDIQAEQPHLADAPTCTPQDAAPKKEETKPKAPENTAETEDGIQTEETGQEQEETPENLPQENSPAAPTDPESLIPPDSEASNKEYTILKNSLIPDNENFGVIKIVTESFGNGSFLAEDLGTWLKKQDFFHISVVEDNGSYKTLYYKANLEAQMQAEEAFPYEKEAAPLYFSWLVEEGDLITNTDSCLEAVTSVEPDGSFYTTYSLCTASEEN